MSLLTPDTPRSPDFLYSVVSTSFADMPSCWNKYSTTPGSSAPGRVPMQRPSSAVKPKLLSMLRPPIMAHRLAPLPRCATITRPCAISGATRGRADAMYSYDSP